jgi:hypothetical protein
MIVNVLYEIVFFIYLLLLLHLICFHQYKLNDMRCLIEEEKKNRISAVFFHYYNYCCFFFKMTQYFFFCRSLSLDRSDMSVFFFLMFSVFFSMSRCVTLRFFVHLIIPLSFYGMFFFVCSFI